MHVIRQCVLVISQRPIKRIFKTDSEEIQWPSISKSYVSILKYFMQYCHLSKYNALCWQQLNNFFFFSFSINNEWKLARAEEGHDGLYISPTRVSLQSQRRNQDMFTQMLMLKLTCKIVQLVQISWQLKRVSRSVGQVQCRLKSGA